jgi:hypothetical protein
MLDVLVLVHQRPVNSGQLTGGSSGEDDHFAGDAAKRFRRPPGTQFVALFGGRLGDDMPKRIYFSLENTGLQGGYWVKLHARVLCF